MERTRPYTVWKSSVDSSAVILPATWRKLLLTSLSRADSELNEFAVNSNTVRTRRPLALRPANGHAVPQHTGNDFKITSDCWKRRENFRKYFLPRTVSDVVIDCMCICNWLSCVAKGIVGGTSALSLYLGCLKIVGKFSFCRKIFVHNAKSGTKTTFWGKFGDKI